MVLWWTRERSSAVFVYVRLIYGGSIDLLTLARNARTSVEMIVNSYANPLSAEMSFALLLGKRAK